ncbi:MAG: hypothetical protein V3V10_07185 [Planctomycetota bacterium]
MIIEATIIGVFILLAVIINGAMATMQAKVKLGAIAEAMKTVTSMLPNSMISPMGIDDLPEDFDGGPVANPFEPKV